MGTLHRAEVSWDGVTITGPTKDATQFGTRASLFLGVFDDNESWAIEARLAYYAYFDGFTTQYEDRSEYYFYFNNGNDPATGSFVAGTFFIFEADGLNGASYKAGGTIAIEKEMDLDELRFITPLGTVTKALSSFETPDDSRLRVNSMAHQFVRPNLLSAAGSEEAHWYDFFSLEDGTPYRGTALSSTDPGAWSGWTPVTFGFPSGSLATTNDAQEATRYQTGFSYSGGSVASGSREWRVWTGGDSLNASADSLLDMIHLGEHGAHELAYILTDSRDTLRWQRTHDKFGSAAAGTIYTGTANSSPSVQWAFGKLYVAWEDGGNILLSVSSDLSQSWSASPLTVTAGTNPRLLTDPRSGFSWLFYVSGGDLYVLRSGNFFADLVGTAMLVVAGVGAQTVAAQLGLDENLVLAYQSSGSIITLRSSDLGRTWS